MKNAILIVDDSRLNRETLADILKINITLSRQRMAGAVWRFWRKEKMISCW